MSVEPAGDPSARRAFERGLGFPPDPFQRRAFDAVDAGRSVLVAAPTGSGKTVVAEYAVTAALAASRKAFYTTPIKALSNQKYQDLARVHGRDRVGLLTGDNAINGDAPVVVMTTEVLRNMIYEGSAALRRLGVVVLDEVHYLQDPYRGAVWEEVIIHLGQEVRLVCLSATVSNAEEFGDWLRTVRGDTDVVIEERRPVELEHLYVVSLRGRPDLLVLPTFVEQRGRRIPNPRASEYDPAGPGRRGSRPSSGRRYGPRAVSPRRVDVVEELDARGMLPGIYFVFSRAGCNDAVEQCLAAGLRLLGPEQRKEVRAIADRHCTSLSDAELEVLGYGRWISGLEAGIAAHHAGMVPPMKEAVEEAFSQGLVKAVFATETLALGINMPARSVAIEKLTKFTGERHESLTPGEYTQLTGRAGRRGIDEIGFAVVLWNRFSVFDQVAGLASKRTYELTSSFRPTYNMAVNLVRRYDPDEAHHLLNLSFAQYRIDREVVAEERRAEEIDRRLADARAALHCELGDLEEYDALATEVERVRQEVRGREARDTALTRLRPGDVVHAGPRIGRVVVVSRSHGRGGSPRLTGLSERGRTVRLGPDSFREPPEVIGRVRLPEPYQPKSPTFRRQAVDRLRKARSGPPPASSVRAGSERRLADLEARLRRHPVAGCPDLPRHRAAREEVRRLARQSDRYHRRGERATDTLARRFDQVLDVLTRRGYVDEWSLTGRGRTLRRIYSESDLLVAEALHQGLFGGLDAAETAALTSIFTYEERGPEGRRARVAWPTERLARRSHRVEDLARDLRAMERSVGLPEMREPDAGFVEPAYAWASGLGLDDVLGDEELSGGDFVRNVKQLIDLLRQIGDAADDVATRQQARSVADALFRGVVEASARVGA